MPLSCLCGKLLVLIFGGTMRFVSICLVLLFVAFVHGCSSNSALSGDSSAPSDADSGDLGASSEAQDRPDTLVDSAGHDAEQDSTSRDVASEETPELPKEYEQWFYPECETADGTCPAKCFLAELQVAPTSCGPWSIIKVGCMPQVVMTGAVCLIRLSDNEVIVTDRYPHTRDGLASCQDAGVGTNSMATCRSDGGEN
jgi:hypothetical protein